MRMTASVFQQLISVFSAFIVFVKPHEQWVSDFLRVIRADHLPKTAERQQNITGVIIISQKGNLSFTLKNEQNPIEIYVLFNLTKHITPFMYSAPSDCFYPNSANDAKKRFTPCKATV